MSQVLSFDFTWYVSQVGVGPVLSFFCAWYLSQVQLARLKYPDPDQVWVGQVFTFFFF